MTNGKVAVFAALLAGCGQEVGFDSRETGEPPRRVVALTDRYVQSPLPKVDLLFVVDPTASMAQEQAALADQFTGLADALDEAGITWQVGVTSTDVGRDGGLLLGHPYVLSATTPDRDLAFAEAIQVGTDGLEEAGIEAALLALDETGPGRANAGFRRQDAVLHVVFVSDADDSSPLDDPEGTFVERLEAETAVTGLPAFASAIVGDAPSGCVSALGTARSGETYLAVAEETGGIHVSICTADVAAPLAGVGEASKALETVFPLRTVPVEDSVRATVDGAQVTDFALEIVDSEAQVRFAVAPPASSEVSISYLVEVAAGP